MSKRLSPATIIACVALFFSLGGASLAASRYIITRASQIKPSVRHELRGRQGPRGPVGPAGIAGAQGLPGATGPVASAASVQATEAHSSTITLCAAGGGACQVGSAIAKCPAGTLALSGGIDSASKPPTDISISVSRMYGSQLGWELTVTNNASLSVSFFAEAWCSAG